MTMPLLAAGHNGSFWMPVQASTFAGETDAIFYFIYWLCVVFFIMIVGAIGYFAVKYKMKGPDDRTSPIRGNHQLEIIWSVIPSILLLVMFAWGFSAFMDQQRPPADAIDVSVTGQKWSWAMTYENGATEMNHLVVPVNQPVQLTMHSTDVLHSFFIPAFRVKRDVIPNRYTTIWFEATEIGAYHIFCTEYCGTSHSDMIGTVDVVTQEEYEEHLGSLGGCEEGQSLAECGEAVFTGSGCGACHSVVGTDVLIGPPLSGLFGSERNFEDGSVASADENYIRQSIMEPNSQVVQGFAPQMPTFAGRIDDEQLTALIAYIRELGE